MPASLKIAAVFVVLAGAVLALLFGSDASDAFVYSKLVHEVMAFLLLNSVVGTGWSLAAHHAEPLQEVTQTLAAAIVAQT